MHLGSFTNLNYVLMKGTSFVLALCLINLGRGEVPVVRIKTPFRPYSLPHYELMDQLIFQILAFNMHVSKIETVEEASHQCLALHGVFPPSKTTAMGRGNSQDGSVCGRGI